MKDTDDMKRTSILLPKELHQKFAKYSKAEYKTLSTLMVDWMNAYVKEHEIEEELKSARKNIHIKISDILFQYSTCFSATSDNNSISKELSSIVIELANNPEIYKTDAFKMRLQLLERTVKEKTALPKK